MENEVRYHMLRPLQVVKRRKECPVAYIPIGTIEWHGRHNPLGADTLQAEGLAVMCAQKGGGLVFPSLYYGENRLESLMEANMFAFFIALVLQSLLERELRKNMITKNQENMYIYPEDRECKSPTTSIAFDRFSHVSRYEISENGKVVERYNDPFSKSQMEILAMLNITEKEYWNDVR